MLLLLIDHIVEFVEFNKQVIATKSCMIGYAIYIVTQQTKSYVRCNHIHGDHKCNKHQGMIFFLNVSSLQLKNNNDKRCSIIRKENIFHSAL